jgi:hypothetical protein
MFLRERLPGSFILSPAGRSPATRLRGTGARKAARQIPGRISNLRPQARGQVHHGRYACVSLSCARQRQGLPGCLLKPQRMSATWPSYNQMSV